MSWRLLLGGHTHFRIREFGVRSFTKKEKERKGILSNELTTALFLLILLGVLSVGYIIYIYFQWVVTFKELAIGASQRVIIIIMTPS